MPVYRAIGGCDLAGAAASGPRIKSSTGLSRHLPAFAVLSHRVGLDWAISLRGSSRPVSSNAALYRQFWSAKCRQTPMVDAVESGHSKRTRKSPTVRASPGPWVRPSASGHSLWGVWEIRAKGS